MPKQARPVTSHPFAFRLWDGGTDQRYLQQFQQWVDHHMNTSPGVQGKPSKAVALVIKALIDEVMGWAPATSTSGLTISLTDEIRSAIRDEVERVVRQMATTPEHLARLERIAPPGGDGIDEDELQAFLADLNQ